MTNRTLAGILLAAAFVTITTLAWLNVGAVAAASDELRSAQSDEPIPDCEPWRKAGQWTMYTCEEDWELGVQCIHSDSGFMDCKWDE